MLTSQQASGSNNESEMDDRAWIAVSSDLEADVDNKGKLAHTQSCCFLTSLVICQGLSKDWCK